MIANQQRSCHWEPSDQEIRIPAADDHDPQQAIAELVEKAERLRIGRRALRLGNDWRQRAIKVEAEDDPRRRYG
jgi:hypothetical protein